MISNFILYKNTKILAYPDFFNPDLRQFWIKSALFTSRNPDFSVFPRCCVISPLTDWSLGKIWQLSEATQVCSWSPMNILKYGNNGHNCAQHSANRGDDYYVTQGLSISCWSSEVTPRHHGFSLLISDHDQCSVCAECYPWVYCLQCTSCRKFRNICVSPKSQIFSQPSNPKLLT